MRLRAVSALAVDRDLDGIGIGVVDAGRDADLSGRKVVANMQRDAREVLGVDVVSGYGLTECPALVLNHAGDPDDVLATDGRTMVAKVIGTDCTDAGS